MITDRRFDRYRELQSYVSWTDEDARRIGAVASLLDPDLPALIDDFYAQLERHPAAFNVIRGGQPQIDRHKATLLQWVRELLAGRYDESYVDRLWLVGWRHVEIGLDQVYANVALSRLRTGLGRVLQENWKGDHALLEETARSLNKLLDLDLAIIEAAYQSELALRLPRTEQLAVLGQVTGGVVEGQRAGDKLKRQAEIIRSLLENASDAIVVVDVHGKILLCNPAVERLIGPLRVGAPPEEWALLGMAYHPDTATTYSLQELPLVRALRREPVTDEEVFVRQPGAHSGRWMSVNASPICDDGVIKGAVVIYRDITERKRAEEELRRQRDLAEGLIDAAPAVVVLLSPEGRIVRFNHFAEELSGYRAEEVLDRDFFETLLPVRDRIRIREVFRKTLDEVETRGTANLIVTKSGREREIRWSHRVLNDAESRIVGVLAIGQDITDLKEAQERALHAERLAAIGEMVAGLAHESRNALQRSQACLEMLSLHVQDRPKAIDLIDRLQQAQDQLHLLYEDVRGYVAPIRLERRNCKLAEIWREAWINLKPQRTGRVAALVEMSDDPDLRWMVDPFRLGQVFHNILENALTACSDPVKIEVCCRRIEVDGPPLLQVTVRDNGPGVALEYRERVFEPFYTTKTKGTGLGMAIARRIIEAHGGQIAVGEAIGQGAEIVITLPLGES